MEVNSSTNGGKLLRHVLTELEDSVLNADRVNDVRAEIQDITARKEGHIKRERRIREDILNTLESYSKEEAYDFFKKHQNYIMDQVDATLNDYEKALSEFLDRDLQAKQEELDSYRAKSVRAIETFLSRDPIDPIESEITVRYVEGGYEARYKCICPKELEYEFMLNSSEIEFLKSRLEGSDLEKGLKLPVRVGKTWVSKEPAIDFERFDTYYMTSATLSESNLFATFTDDETGSEFKFHSSVSEDTAFLEIDYKDSIQAVSLTSQPALNSNLNRESANAMMNQLRNAFKSLRDHKLRLSKLVLRDTDAISNLRAGDVFLTVLEILSPRLKEEASQVLTSDGQNVPEGEKPVTRDFVINRLELLGERAKTVSALLGITGIADTGAGSG